MTVTSSCATLAEVLAQHARTRGERVWAFDGTTGNEWTFAAFDDLVDRACVWLLDQGAVPGEIVSAVLHNRIEYLVLYFASLRLGTVFNPFPFSLHPQDVAKNLHYTLPTLVLAQQRHFDHLREHGPQARYSLVEDETEGGGFLAALGTLAPTEAPETVDPAQPACIYYSSGTTGDPKGIVYSHANMMALIASIVRGFGWTANDRHLVFLPLGHTASINYSVLPCMLSGGGIALHESFWKVRSHIWHLIAQHDIRYMEVVPSVLFSMLNTPYPDYDREDITGFRWVGCGSAPLPVEVQNRFQARFGLGVGNLYGLSETGPTHIDDPGEPDWQPGSIGRPLDVNEVAILDIEGSPCPAGEVGEIAIKGPNVFIGYYRNERAYRDTFHGDFYRTGDLGFVDADGRFHFSDRRKDLIIKGGVNIFPGEIDEILFAHPSVKEAATIGIPDDYLGERIKSFVVPAGNKRLDEETLRQHCLDAVGPFKCPDTFVLVDDIPKGPSGKLLRRVLVERERADHADV